MKKKNAKKIASDSRVISRIYRQQLAGHGAILKQLISISLDMAASLVTLTRLNELRAKQDTQMDRIIEIERKLLRGMVHLEERARIPMLSEANTFMSRPLKGWT